MIQMEFINFSSNITENNKNVFQNKTACPSDINRSQFYNFIIEYISVYYVLIYLLETCFWLSGNEF